MKSGPEQQNIDFGEAEEPLKRRYKKLLDPPSRGLPGSPGKKLPESADKKSPTPSGGKSPEPRGSELPKLHEKDECQYCGNSFKDPGGCYFCRDKK